MSRVGRSDADIIMADFGGGTSQRALRKNVVKVLAIASAQPLLAGNS
jgi:hypothetical protein